MKKPVLFFFIAAIGIVFSAAPSRADEPAADLAAGVARSIEILRKEIERDEEIISMPMNLPRLNDTRSKFSDDLPEKEDVVKMLESFRGDERLGEAIDVMIRSAAQEREIADNPRRTHSARRRAFHAIRENLAAKKKALKDFEGWIP